jgi:UDP-2,3-diacylglucosamine pyrophosphatase LpxH
MDFSSACYTAVISDLHLCEAEPVNKKYPLWKKFKTKEFFFDDVFESFLLHLEEKSKNQPIELILNGDIFDFDSVTSIPDHPTYRTSWVEQKSGLFPRVERSLYKIEVILRDHPIFISALQKFINKGHRLVFIIGNHDIELQFSEVREKIIEALNLSLELKKSVRFCEWFYLSNKDTLIEHGNQYDPYCVCEDPLNPFTLGYNHYALKLPFGNLACRYIVNGMGFFNPHVDSNYIMSLKDYVFIFFRYMARAQPLLVLNWLTGAVLTLAHSFVDRLRPALRNPLKIENRVEDIAYRSNVEPRVVRELRELFAAPASSRPFLLMRELWLDRALILIVTAFVLFQLFSIIRAVYHVSFFWIFIPFFLFFPFFLFYSRSITSLVSGYKEPNDRTLFMSGIITGARRIVYGHTHIARHEMIGSIEHLNSGCWSPAFLDIECTRAIDLKTFVWIFGDANDPTVPRTAELLQFTGKTSTFAKMKPRSLQRNTKFVS